MISATAVPLPVSAKTTVPPDVLSTRELVGLEVCAAVVTTSVWAKTVIAHPRIAKAISFMAIFAVSIWTDR